ncbi:MAG: hypothetical protein RBG13Loki_1912 [Promethearchaeota archaeon CR_4]|nr:MAG: hypothetical protein RBG13Loki_1912 [Candidatus Lokiarchaeota archaeon CR_4]
MIWAVEEKKQKIIRERYNESAAIYNSRYGAIQREKFRISLSPETLNSLVNEILLDIGCGTGLFGTYLRELIPEGRFTIVGIDISEEMIKRAREGGVNNCIIADIVTVPIRPGCIHAAVSFTAFQNLTNWKEGVDAMFQALSRGGIFIASILKMCIEAVEFFSYLKRVTRVFFPFEVNQIEDFIVRGQKR